MIFDTLFALEETLGSGPFKFVREQFEPGHKVVYVKNPHYVPRSEPPDWGSGGKVAMSNGSNGSLSPSLRRRRCARGRRGRLVGDPTWLGFSRPIPTSWSKTLTRLGSMGLLRFNQLQPPLDNVKMRQACWE
jgi:peptide/nickel transport system substrate-binding protein